MITVDQIQDLLSHDGTVVGDGGEKIGKITQVYLDEATGTPEWVTAKTGMFGGAASFVPIAESTLQGTELRVHYDKARVKEAPRMEDAEAHLSPAQEAQLYAYYGIGRPEASAGTDRDLHRPVRAGEGGLTGRGATGNGPDAMTRSEEQLNVVKETVGAGTARLRKFVVTEGVTQTVPVSHEEVRVVHEPITDENRDAAMAGADITADEHHVTLTREEVVVTKNTVPVERVRIDTETVTENQQVNEEIRKEQIVSETSDEPRRRQR